MADNTGEEPLDIPSNIQSENSSGKITPAADTDAINPNQETENMEVHHHPDLHHSPKKWKEYFLEGFMIFVAVTMGFFAESYHTHLINKDIEKRNVESFISNIKKDSTNLIQAISGCENKIKWIDSLIKIPGGFSDSIFEKKFFSYSGRLMEIVDFSPDESAFLQMQSSGTLRLINKQNIVDSILKYHNQNLLIQKHQESVKDIFFKGFDNFIQIADFRKEASKFIGNTQQIQNYINYKSVEGSATELSVIFLKQQLINANNLIAFLEKEYSLDN